MIRLSSVIWTAASTFIFRYCGINRLPVRSCFVALPVSLTFGHERCSWIVHCAVLARPCTSSPSSSSFQFTAPRNQWALLAENSENIARASAVSNNYEDYSFNQDVTLKTCTPLFASLRDWVGSVVWWLRCRKTSTGEHVEEGHLFQQMIIQCNVLSFTDLYIYSSSVRRKILAWMRVKRTEWSLLIELYHVQPSQAFTPRKDQRNKQHTIWNLRMRT